MPHRRAAEFNKAIGELVLAVIECAMPSSSSINQILEDLPKNIEPGESFWAPSDLADRVAVLSSQAAIVWTLRWVMENKDWLRRCKFSVQEEDQYIFLSRGDVDWAEGVSSQDIIKGSDAISRLTNQLEDFCNDLTLHTIRSIIHGMNGIQWDPKFAFEVLVSVCPRMQEDDPESWLKGHLAHWEAEKLKKGTPKVSPHAKARL